MQSFPREHLPQDKIAHLERPGAGAAAVIPSQRLLVSCRPERGLTVAFLPEHEVHPLHGVLMCLVKRQDPRGAMPDLVREDRFCSVDEEEWGLARRLGDGGADGPQHGLELVVPAPTAGLELLLEGPGLEASQDLRVYAFSLAIAPGVRHRSVADLVPRLA